MDFINWCSVVLNNLIETRQTKENAWHVGVSVDAPAKAFFGRALYQIGGTEQGEAIISALYELENLGLILRTDNGPPAYDIPRDSQQLATDMTPLWEALCSESLTQQEEQLLKAVNRLTEHTSDDYAWIEAVDHELIVEELDWKNENIFWSVANQLERQLHFVAREPGGQFRTTYRGLVWEHRRGFTLESKFIDALVREWETTSVDFKRELYLDTADHKAEFIKDIIGLANTQASGRRWLIIGFDDKTRAYYGPPDPSLNQDRIEDLLSVYTSPIIEARYEVIDYKAGQVGKLEVLRDPKKLPYKVAKSVGDKSARDKKRIEQGQIFVRHSSHTEEPTAEELKRIEQEGDYARSWG